MKLLLIPPAIIAAYTIAQLLFSGYFLLQSPRLTRRSFAGQTEHGNKSKTELKLFLAGDSVAAGVGASSFNTSLGGRLANSLAADHHVIFTNAAATGSRMADLMVVPEENQDIIVLFIASNDLFHFTDLKKFENDTNAAMDRYSKRARKVIVVGPANIGGATAIPLVIKPFYYLQWPKYASIMKSAAAKYPNIVYIYPADYKDKLKTYGQTEAKDGFHPNDNGHKFWAELILSKIQHY